MTFRFPIPVAVGLIALAISLLTASCGEESAQPPDAAWLTASPPTAVLASPASTPLPLPTFDPSTTLVEFHSVDKGYSVSYPEGWQVDAGSGTYRDTFLLSSSTGRALAQLSISCNREENLTVLDLMRITQAAVSEYGQVNLAEATPVAIAGTTGKQLRFSITVGTVVVEQSVAFVVQGDCGWRVGFAAYGEGQLEQYLPLFDRIIASFQPT